MPKLSDVPVMNDTMLRLECLKSAVAIGHKGADTTLDVARMFYKYVKG